MGGIGGALGQGRAGGGIETLRAFPQSLPLALLGAPHRVGSAADRIVTETLGCGGSASVTRACWRADRIW